MTIASINKRITELSSANSIPGEQHIYIRDDRIYFPAREFLYIPSKTGVAFHNDLSLVRLMMGPYGSGKTTACCMEVLRQACSAPRCKDGVRRVSVAMVRNTFSQLETTTFESWWDIAGNLGMSKSTKGRTFDCRHVFNDGKGVIELDVLFIALDKDTDIDRFKSLQVSMAYLNEMSELPASSLTHLVARVGRYPNIKDLESGCEPLAVIVCDTNPPDTDSWIYNLFEVRRPEGRKIFKQPPALLRTANGWVTNPEADNIKNLRADYYTNMACGETEEFIKVFCLGEYGVTRDGKPVYPQYNDDLHGVDTIPLLDNEPLYLGFDGGLTPACLVCQIVNDQVRVIYEFVTDRMGMLELAELVERWIGRYAKDCPIVAVCDPACTKGDEITSDVSAYHILYKKFNCVPALTNNIQPRIEAVNYYLNRLVSGKPAIIVSKQDCPMLRKGFLNSYIYKRVRLLNKEEYKDTPNKSHPYSDIHDCLQYIALNYKGNYDNLSKNSLSDGRLLNDFNSMWV